MDSVVVIFLNSMEGKAAQLLMMLSLFVDRPGSFSPS